DEAPAMEFMRWWGLEAHAKGVAGGVVMPSDRGDQHPAFPVDAHRRLLLGQCTEWLHELFEDAATTAVTQLANLVVENFSVAHRILADHASEQVVAEGVELGADLPQLARCLCSFAQQPADGLAVAPGL